MGRTVELRKKLYRDLMRTTTGNRVLSSDQKKIGIIRNLAAEPYRGEAGFSNRCWVLWSDGRQTLCTYKGMEEHKDGWRIL